jgi:hypothetical protein
MLLLGKLLARLEVLVGRKVGGVASNAAALRLLWPPCCQFCDWTVSSLVLLLDKLLARAGGAAGAQGGQLV